MAAPTQDIGHPDLSWGTWGQGLLTQWYETAPDLIWPQSVVTFGRMRNDPQIKAVLGAYVHPLMRATWVLDPDGCRPEVVKHVADDLGVGILGTDLKPGPARRRGVIWARHLKDALSYLTFGHAIFERRYEIDASGAAHLANLGSRTQWTIANMAVGTDGTLDYINQSTQGDPIPGSRLVWYVNEQEGSNWAGTSMLRPAFGAWLLKNETWRVHATSIRRFGMGVPTVTAPAGATQAQVSQAQQLASSMRAGDAAGMGLPQGFQASLMGITGSVPDALAFIKYLDIAMAKMVHAGLIELGQTDNGSRALGETFMDMFQLALQSVADQVATTVTSGYPGLPGLITDIVDQNWGENEPAPRLLCTDVGQNYEISANAIQSLVMSGAMTPDPGLDEWVRNTWRLPKRTDKWVPSSRGLPAGTAISPKAEIDSGNGPPGAQPAAPAAPGGAPTQKSQAPAAGGPRESITLWGAAKTPTRKQQTYIAASSWEPTQHQDDWERALATLLLQYRAVMSAQRTDLVDRVIDAMEAGGDAASLVVAAPEVGEGPSMITTAMVTVARRAAQSMVDEALRQGVHIDMENVRIDAESLGGTAKARALFYSGWMAQQATAKALQVYGPTPAGFLQAANEVTKFLDGLSDDTVKSQLGAALTAAQNHGRFAVLEAAPESAGTAKYVAAEFLDNNTCEHCRAEDGTEFDSIEAAQESYPTGGYAECEGLLRCRGTVVAVWGGNEPATDRGTGYLNLAAGAGEPGPKAPGGTRSDPGPDDCYRTGLGFVVHGPGCPCDAPRHSQVCACLRPSPIVDARLDVTGLLTVEGAFDNKEIRDPHTGKWIKDPAGHYLDEALKEVKNGSGITHKHDTGTADIYHGGAGYRVSFYKREGGKNVRTGDRKVYEHHGDAAEAARRGKHLDDAELKHGSHIGGPKRAEPKPEPKPEPKVEPPKAEPKPDVPEPHAFRPGQRIVTHNGDHGEVLEVRRVDDGNSARVKLDDRKISSWYMQKNLAHEDAEPKTEPRAPEVKPEAPKLDMKAEPPAGKPVKVAGLPDGYSATRGGEGRYGKPDVLIHDPEGTQVLRLAYVDIQHGPGRLKGQEHGYKERGYAYHITDKALLDHLAEKRSEALERGDRYVPDAKIKPGSARPLGEALRQGLMSHKEWVSGRDLKRPKAEPRESLATDANSSDVLSALKAGKASGIAKQDKPVKGGADTAVTHFNDGTVLVRKTFPAADAGQIDNEVVASRISKIIGAGGPTVVRDPDDPNTMWQPFVPDAKTAGEHFNEGKGGATDAELRAVTGTREGAKIALLDQVIGNADRSSGNWLVKDGKPIPIDHGDSFEAGEAFTPFTQEHDVAGMRTALIRLRVGIPGATSDLTPAQKDLMKVAVARVNGLLNGTDLPGKGFSTKEARKIPRAPNILRDRFAYAEWEKEYPKAERLKALPPLPENLDRLSAADLHDEIDKQHAAAEKLHVSDTREHDQRVAGLYSALDAAKQRESTAALSKDVREFQRGGSEPSAALAEAVAKAGPDAPEIHRGLVDKHGDPEKIAKLNAISTAKPGTVLDGGGAITSWSSDKNVASDFAGAVSPGGTEMRGGQTGVVLRMEPGAHALSVGDLGQPGYAHQKEWLARPSNLEVVSNDPHPTVKGLRVVTVRETTKSPETEPLRAHPADVILRSSNPKDVASGMTDADLVNAHAELVRRADLLGKPDQVSKPHRAVIDEIKRRSDEGKPKPGADLKMKAAPGADWVKDGASYHHATINGQDYTLHTGAGRGWDVYRGKGSVKFLGKPIGHGGTAAEAKKIAEGDAVNPILPDGYSLKELDDTDTLVRLDGKGVGAIFKVGPAETPYEWHFRGPDQHFSGFARSKTEAVLRIKDKRDSTTILKPPRPPKTDVSKLSGATRNPDTASPLEAHFIAEYRAEGPNNVNGFSVKDRASITTVRNVEMYSRVPEGSRRYLAKRHVELYFGTRPITELDHLTGLAKDQPNGYAKGQTFSKVAAVVTSYWDPKAKSMKNIVAIGGGNRTYGSGSVNVSAHEAAHALDRTTDSPSSRPEFQKLRDDILTQFRVEPYYVQSDNTSGAGSREFFAESYAAWAESKAKQHTAEEAAYAAMLAVGATTYTHHLDPGTMKSTKAMETLGARLVKFFDAYQAEIDGKVA